MIDEVEWYSRCCKAPPLYELDDNGACELSGVCMSCRCNATFQVEGVE